MGLKLMHDCAVEMRQELLSLCELPSLYTEEGVSQVAGLVFDVLEGEGAIGFEGLQALRD
jgi:hypothetical protein